MESDDERCCFLLLSCWDSCCQNRTLSAKKCYLKTPSAGLRKDAKFGWLSLFIFQDREQRAAKLGVAGESLFNGKVSVEG